jgi:hypothetical protein
VRRLDFRLRKAARQRSNRRRRRRRIEAIESYILPAVGARVRTPPTKMAKLCYENGLTKKPDIVSYIRVAMECLSQYTISQKQKEGSAVMKQQKKKEGDREAVEKREDQYENQAMIIITPKGAGTAVGEIGTERTRSGLSDLELYFQPAFDELNKLNRLLDSLIEEENNKEREKKKK